MNDKRSHEQLEGSFANVTVRDLVGKVYLVRVVSTDILE